MSTNTTHYGSVVVIETPYNGSAEKRITTYSDMTGLQASVLSSTTEYTLFSTYCSRLPMLTAPNIEASIATLQRELDNRAIARIRLANQGN